jgi:lauroyl/myristoyl acyltransferase
MALPRAWFRLLWYRGLPLAMLTRWVKLEQSLQLHSRRRTERTIRCIRQLMPDLDDRQTRAVLLRTRVLRRLGGHTFAPVVWRSRPWLLRTCNPIGLDHLEKLKQEGRGVIVLGLHAGFNAWNGPVLMNLGYPMRLMQRSGVSAGKLLLLRLSGWAESVLPYPEAGSEGIHLKWLHDLLRQGEWVQHVADHPDPNGFDGTLFGQHIRWCRAPWMLARLSGAAAVPVVIRANAELQPQLVIGPPLRVSTEGAAAEAAMAAFHQYLAFVEETLKEHPWNLTPRDWNRMSIRRTE